MIKLQYQWIGFTTIDALVQPLDPLHVISCPSPLRLVPLLSLLFVLGTMVLIVPSMIFSLILFSFSFYWIVSSFYCLDPVAVGATYFTFSYLFFDRSDGVRAIYHIGDVVWLLFYMIKLQYQWIGFTTIDALVQPLDPLHVISCPSPLRLVPLLSLLFVLGTMVLIVPSMIFSLILFSFFGILERHQSPDFLFQDSSQNLCSTLFLSQTISFQSLWVSLSETSWVVFVFCDRSIVRKVFDHLFKPLALYQKLFAVRGCLLDRLQLSLPCATIDVWVHGLFDFINHIVDCRFHRLHQSLGSLNRRELRHSWCLVHACDRQCRHCLT